SIDWFSENLDAILVPLYVGTAFYSVVVSSLIYILLNRLWISSVTRERALKEQQRKAKAEQEQS
ncbi:MAG: flagellar biosynthesis protein FlhF, partial [Sulfurovum sp. 28-43-6]